MEEETKKVCPKCNGDTYIKRPDGRWVECECKMIPLRRANLIKNGIDPNIRGLIDFETDLQDNKQYMKQIKTVLQNFTDDHKNKNLLLTGNTGLGKTRASQCIAVEILNKGYTVYYRPLGRLLDQLMIDKTDAKYKYQSEIKKLAEYDLLVLDDLGAETLTEAKLAELFNLIDERLVGKKSTIISSNLTPDDIEKQYSGRIASRINGEYTPIFFKGKDLRYE